MLFERNDGTCAAGDLDVLCLLHDVTTGLYHAAFFEESPVPGPVKPVQEMTFIRLKSRMHHTQGAKTEAEGRGQLFELSQKIAVPSENIWDNPLPWDGKTPVVWLGPNWKKPQ